MKFLKPLLALALLAPSFAIAQDVWKSDPPHSRLSFTIDHLAINEVSGVFDKFDVTVVATKADFSDATFELTVDVASIDTDVEKRDNHLRSPDFFEVQKFPSMTFKSASIKPAGKDRFKLTGDLTLHGKTQTVTMDLWHRGVTNNQGKSVAGFQLTGTLKRSDFGVGPKFPPPMVGDVVSIKADGEFIKQ